MYIYVQCGEYYKAVDYGVFPGTRSINGIGLDGTGGG